MENIITFSNVSKKYGATKALNNISFQIAKGGIIGLVGTHFKRGRVNKFFYCSL